MRLAIVHYHLRPGGVTRVIRNALDALAKMGDRDIRAVVLTGEMPEDAETWPASLREIEGLAYGARTRPDDLADAVERAAAEALGVAPDLWHIHNHSLGKSSAWPGAVRALAERGRRLVLQIHDFAEDGRPNAYGALLDIVGEGDVGRLGKILYPTASHVHYAALNPRDERFLAEAGVAKAQRTLLPNAVALEASSPSPPSSPSGNECRRFVYPTRAIRRKNLGEFLLWSALGEADDRFAVTLAPKNPTEQPLYRRWVALAERLHLPVEFDWARTSGMSFEAVMASAHALVTTSLQEGFGLAFLEPWWVGRALLGRDLPEVTARFGDDGISLDGLYRRLDVPVEWVGGREALRTTWTEAFTQYLATYRRAPRAGDADRLVAASVCDKGVDFARLDEAAQRRVIERVAAAPEAARAYLHPSSLGALPPDNRIAAHRRAIETHYNLTQYGQRLITLYTRVAAAPTSRVGSLRADRLLDRFLAPERFHTLTGRPA